MEELVPCTKQFANSLLLFTITTVIAHFFVLENFKESASELQVPQHLEIYVPAIV